MTITDPAGTRRERLRRLAVPSRALLLLVVGALGVPASAAAAPEPETLYAQAAMVQTIAELRDRSGPNDQSYWADGAFQGASADPCGPCNLGPATAAAEIRNLDPTAPSWLDTIAIETFDHAVDLQDDDGVFAYPSSSPVIWSMFTANELGHALLSLRGRLPEATRQRWTAALKRTSDMVLARGETTYYANGNIQVGYAEMLYLTWLATGDEHYLSEYHRAWDFAISPPQDVTRSGRGLIVTRQPSSPDGRDGAGYLTEQDGSNLGYDPSYTQLQADVVTRLWQLTRYPAVLRVLNLLTNKLLERVDGNAMLNTTGGTRVSLGLQPFLTPAVSVLVRSAGRTDLASRELQQLPQVVGDYVTLRTAPTLHQYRSFGTHAMPMLRARYEGSSPVVPPAPYAAPAAAPGAAAP